MVLCLLGLGNPSPAEARWWFGTQSSWEKSGLDLQQGYDRNTVVALSGTLVHVDLDTADGPVVAVIKTDSETVSLVLGPREFWDKQGLSLNPGEQISVRGSKAQGQDGRVYLLVQSMHTPGTGREVVLRNPSGRPAWSGGLRQMAPRPMPMRQMRGGPNH